MTNQWYHQNHHHPQGPGPNMYNILSVNDAMNIALAQVPGYVVKVELEHEHGRQIWEVDIRAQNGIKYEVEIDAHSGQVLRVKRD